jgi:hypothetical protein
MASASTARNVVTVCTLCHRRLSDNNDCNIKNNGWLLFAQVHSSENFKTKAHNQNLAIKMFFHYSFFNRNPLQMGQKFLSCKMTKTEQKLDIIININ